MIMPATIIWFRRDLRLTDNPALLAAIRRGGPILPVFIWAPDEEAPWAPGAASRWWLHHSLVALDCDLCRRGASLIVRQGSSLAILQDVIRDTGATAVFWNRLYDPAIRQRDAQVAAALKKAGVEVQSFAGHLLFEPVDIANKSGKPFQVFTPFWNRCLAEPPPVPPLSAPARMEIVRPQRSTRTASAGFSSVNLAPLVADEKFRALDLLPKIDWAAGLRAAWQPGEAGAQKLLAQFNASDYSAQRDFPAVAGTSRLSPHLHFGEISPRQVWQALPARAIAFRRQLGWREFAHHLLWHFPHTPEQPLRADFAHFPWREDPKALRIWQRGLTGYPIVDAGMRELWRTGWMHNRVRMMAASFLVKDLLLPWQAGARWFWDTLVDADLANNTLGWQWAAGCGADAAPYFRIFNPALQQKKFDPTGDYVRRWVSDQGPAYPAPIVDHAAARDRALEAFSRIRPLDG